MAILLNYLCIGEERELNISIYVNGRWNGNIGIEFTCNQGTRPALLTVAVNIVLLTPYLVTSPSYLTQKVARGEQGFVQFSVENVGSAPSQVV